MATLNFSKAEQDRAFSVVAGILHLGNVNFEETQEGCAVVDKTALESAATLFGIDSTLLGQRLTTRTIKLRDSQASKTIVKPLSKEDAEDNRDSIAKALYNGLFLWVVSRINKESNSTEGENISWIGTLDVFGFEIFENNSFEQFCINFANERLQQFFNYHVLKAEQELYRREALLWTPVDLPENQDVIDLIMGKPSGIFATLDSACVQPKGTDQVFTNNMFAAKGGHPRLVKVGLDPRTPGKRRGSQFKTMNGFSIKHYAGTVVYDAKEFLKKNIDSAHPDTITLFAKSSCQVCSTILSPGNNASNDKGQKWAGNKFKSTSNVFSSQLEDLMKTLKQTTPYFVRCIKPNSVKEPRNFVGDYVRPQLRCGGLVEALRIIKCGFPTRCSYERLHKQFGSILDEFKSVVNLNKRDFTEALIHECTGTEKLNRSEYQLGLSMIFFRPGKQAFFQKILDMSPEEITTAQRKGIHKFLIHKRIVRMRGTIKAYLRVKHLLVFRRIQKAASVVNIINKTMFRSLKRVRKQLNHKHEIEEAERLLKDQKYQNALKAMDELKRMKSKQDELKEKLQKEMDAKNAAQNDISAVQGQMKTLTSKLNEMQQKYRDLEGNLKQEKETSSSLNVRLQEATINNDGLKQALAQSKEKTEANMDEMMKLNDAATRARRESELKSSELENSTKRANSEIQQLEEHLRSLKNDLAKAEDDITKMTEDGKKKQKAFKQEIDEMQRNSSQKEEELNGLISADKNQLAQLTAQLSSLQADHAGIKEQMFKGDDAAKAAAELFAKEKQQLQEEMQSQREQFQGEMSNLKDKIDTVRKEKMTIEDQLTETTGKAERFEDSVSRLEQRAQQTKDEFQTLLANKETELNNILADKKQALSTVDQLREDAQQNEISWKQKNSELKADINTLEDKLEQEKSDSDKTVRQLKKELQNISQGQMKELHEQLTKTKKDLETAQANFAAELTQAKEEKARIVQQKGAEIEEAQKQASDSADQLDLLQKKMKRFEEDTTSSKSQLQVQLEETEEELDTVRQKMQSTQNQLRTTQAKAQDLEHELELAQTQESNLRDQQAREMNQLRGELELANERFDTFKSQSGKHLREVEAELEDEKTARLNQQTKFTRELKAVEQKYLEQLEDAEDQLRTERLAANTANGATEAQLAQWKQTEANYKATIQTLVSEKSDLESDVRMAKEEARRNKKSALTQEKNMQEAERMYQSRITEHLHSLKKAQKKVDVVRQQAQEDLDFQAKSMKSQIDNERRENKKLRQKEVQMSSELSGLKHNIASLNRQLRTAQNKNDEDMSGMEQQMKLKTNTMEQSFAVEREMLQKQVNSAKSSIREMQQQHKIELRSVEEMCQKEADSKLEAEISRVKAEAQDNTHTEEMNQQLREENVMLKKKDMSLNDQFDDLAEELLSTKRQLLDTIEKFDSFKTESQLEKNRLQSRFKLSQMQTELNIKATMITTQKELEKSRAENDMLRQRLSRQVQSGVSEPVEHVFMAEAGNDPADVSRVSSVVESADVSSVSSEFECADVSNVSSAVESVDESTVSSTVEDANETPSDQDEEETREKEEEENMVEELEQEGHDGPAADELIQDDDGTTFDLSAFPTLALLAKNTAIDSPSKHPEKQQLTETEQGDKENMQTNIMA